MGATEFDVLVVGAGPAGATAALLAARRGWRVGLLDKQRYPRDKPCGDALAPSVTVLLQELGLAEVLAGEQPVERLAVYGPDGVGLHTSLTGVVGLPAAGYVVPRAVFDQRLRLAALQAGALDLAGCRAVDSGTEADGRWLQVRGPHGPERVRARLVVAADGAYSMLRRRLGCPRSRPDQTALAMRAYAPLELPPGHHQEMVFEWSRGFLPAYAWVFPTGAGTANVGVGVKLSWLQQRRIDLRQTLERFADVCRQRGTRLGELSGFRSHHLPTAMRLPRLAHPRAVLIGDAGSMINPVSGEGISYGMNAARQLVDRLPGSLADAAELAEALASFERRFRRSHWAHFRSCATAARLMSNPWWAKHMIRAAARDPVVLRDAVQLLFGTGRLHAGTTWRIVRNGR